MGAFHTCKNRQFCKERLLIVLPLACLTLAISLSSISHFLFLQIWDAPLPIPHYPLPITYYLLLLIAKNDFKRNSELYQTARQNLNCRTRNQIQNGRQRPKRNARKTDEKRSS